MRLAPLFAPLLLASACAGAPEAPPVVAIAPASPPPSASGAPPAWEPPTTDGGRLFTPLELAGRAVFVREGCDTCHAGAPVAPREGAGRAPKAAPSLARIGGKYPPLWHAVHLTEPRQVTPGSTMPAFPHLASRRIDADAAALEVGALRDRGAAYPDRDVDGAVTALRAQAAAITRDLEASGGHAAADSELVALIAFLERPVPPLPGAAGASTRRVDPEVLARAVAPGSPAIAKGEAVFQTYCAACHGPSGRGQIGPDLGDATWIHGGEPSAVLSTIAGGVPQKGMPAWDRQLDDEKLVAVTAFVVRGLRAKVVTAPPKPGSKRP
jgi:cbb3-type cytochrome oxidase cytochrome c subunit